MQKNAASLDERLMSLNEEKTFFITQQASAAPAGTDVASNEEKTVVITQEASAASARTDVASNEDIEQYKKQTIQCLNQYISLWKIAFFGHHNNKAANILKGNISKAVSIETIKTLLNTALSSVKPGGYYQSIMKALDVKVLSHKEVTSREETSRRYCCFS
jgi:hypothetical protein